jgi:hypothetical protein
MPLKLVTGAITVEGITDVVTLRSKWPYFSVRDHSGQEEYGTGRPFVVGFAGVVGVAGGLVGMIAAPILAVGFATLPLWGRIPAIRRSIPIKVTWKGQDVSERFSSGPKRVAAECLLGLVGAVGMAVSIPFRAAGMLLSAALVVGGVPLAAAQSVGHRVIHGKAPDWRMQQPYSLQATRPSGVASREPAAPNLGSPVGPSARPQAVLPKPAAGRPDLGGLE